MQSIPKKSRLRYLAHNPTSRLFYILSREAKAYCLKKEHKKRLYESNSGANPS